MFSRETMKSALESMLFVWGDPLPAKAAAEVFDISEEDVLDIFDDLQVEYEEGKRGIQIRRIENSFQLVTSEENADFVRKLCTPVKVKKLSQAALEVLAIVAYKQPVTKGEVESIRGVRCDRIMEGLLAKELIRERGRSQAVGRPHLYGTTEKFLEYFGFESLEDLPEIQDIEGVIDMDEEDESDSRQLRLAIEEV